MSTTAHPADRWLRDQQAALEAELAETLDLEAGLQEILTLARHDELVADLGHKLDLDAGLFEIVPEAKPVPPAGPPPVTALGAPEPRSARHDPTAGVALNDNGDTEKVVITRLPLSYRWELRNIVLQHGLEMACLYARHIVKAQPDRRFPYRSVAWHEWVLFQSDSVPVVRDTAIDGFEAGIDYLASLSNRGEPLLEAFSGDIWELRWLWASRPARARTLAARVSEMRNAVVHRAFRSDFDLTADSVVENFNDFARTLDGTLHALNDFVDADLRQPGLEKEHLDGLRWSAATVFPEDWKEEIDRDSIPIGDGIFEVRPGNTRNTTLA